MEDEEPIHVDTEGGEGETAPENGAQTAQPGGETAAGGQAPAQGGQPVYDETSPKKWFIIHT